jgi:hypothetical protein
MKSLSSEEDGLSLGWDELIPSDVETEFGQVLKKIRFL